ncbi:MAG TPA: DUF488 domain-containing protein [Alphaproteobacteria bacterium]|nr:DUF488 domain-containing protein [Alphaproteobacteria bacterium]
MEVYTIGFTKRKAADFFGALRHANIKRLFDVRLNNSSQLAGFTKKEDLPFFLKELCGAEYIHEPLLAPTQDLLDAYRKQKGSWQEYKNGFLELMNQRRIEEYIDKELFNVPSILLCSEPTADYCHRRLVLEYLQDRWGGITIVHL